VKFWAQAGAARVSKAAHMHRAAMPVCPVRKMNLKKNDFKFDAFELEGFDRKDSDFNGMDFSMSRFRFK
jgi:hypothetical protein